MNLSSSFKHKLSVSKAHIKANEIKEEEDEEISKEPKERKPSIRKVRTRRINSKPNLNKQTAKTETDEEDSENDDSTSHLMNRPRVDRFLSIVEIPPEVVWLTQQKFANNMANKWNDNSIEEADENEPDSNQENETKIEQQAKPNDTAKSKAPKTKCQLDTNKKKHSIFNNNNNMNLFGTDQIFGTGLSQTAKAQIIKDIIRNYDIDRFMNQLRAKEVVQIKLNKNDANARPIRNRIMKLMKSDVIRINDGDYMRELSKRIQKNYEEKQDKLMQNLEDRERKRERKLKLKGLLAKTSEEEEIEKKSRLTLHSLSTSTKLSLRKNSNLLEPIANSTATINSASTLNQGKLPKLIRSNKANNF